MHDIRNPAAIRLSQSVDFAKGFPAALKEPLDRVIATGDHYLPTDYRKVVLLKLGREDHFYLPRILAIGDKLTEFVGAAIILQDVTKFRLLDDAKTNLVGTVSHELKTPLTSLRMAVYLALEEAQGPLNPKQRELLRRGARRLGPVAQDVWIRSSIWLVWRRAHPHSPAARSSFMTCSRKLFRRRRGLFLPQAKPSNWREESSLASISVDPERLRHVFMNLLTNASKYSPSASEITLRAESAPLGFVRFSVKDRGRGIPESARGHLFDRFYRVPDQDKPGAGIGLAIAREIVVAHGGSIGVSERP